MTHKIAAGTKRMPNKEEFINHPEFAERISKEMEGYKFPANEIPLEFDTWLQASLFDISRTALQLNKVQYEALVNIPACNMPFGLLMKAADIIYHSKPCSHVQLGDYMKYSGIIDAAEDMKLKFQEVTDAKRNKVLEALMAKESIIKND